MELDYQNNSNGPEETREIPEENLNELPAENAGCEEDVSTAENGARKESSAPEYTAPAVAPAAAPAPAKKRSGLGVKIALGVVSALLALTLLISFSVFALLGAYALQKRGSVPDVTDPSNRTEVSDALPGEKGSADKQTSSDLPAPAHYNEDDWVNPGALTDENAIVNVAAKCSPSVVTIQVTLSLGSASGSGVIWSSDGYIVTNNHVVEGASSIKVVLENGASYPATLLFTDADNDLALLRINVTGLHAVSVGSSADLKVGQTAVVIGNPLGTLANSVTSGIISALARDINVEGTEMNLMQTTAAINQGNSGGGCFDINGKLIGIVNAKKIATGVEGLGFAIPVDTVKSVISEMIEKDGTSLRKSFGVTACYEVTEENYADFRENYDLFRIIEELNGSPIYGVYIGADGLVDYAKGSDTFENGDVIRTVNGKEMRTLSDLNDVLKDKNVGDELTVVVTRVVTVMSGFRRTRSLEEVTVTVKVIEMYR